MKKWIMKKLGIKEQKSIAEEWSELGKVASEGFIEGLKTGIPTKTKAVFTDDLFVDKADTKENVHDVRTTHDTFDSVKYAVEAMNNSRWYTPGVKDPDGPDTDEPFEPKTFHYEPRDNHTIIEPLIESFTETVWDQQEKVLASGKYEHPVHKDNHSAMGWVDHQMSEFADALVYHECLKQTIDDVFNAVRLAQIANQEGMTKEMVDEYLQYALERLRKG
jgi:hypothetical protein